MDRKKIFDEFTNLPVSRQRKWQLRNREKQREMHKKWWENGGREKHNIVQKASYHRLKNKRNTQLKVASSEEQK